MSRTPKQRAARMREVAGPLALVKVHASKYDSTVWIYRVTCAECPSADMANRTYRSGQPNDYWTALERWAKHLRYAHPDAEAPCRGMVRPDYETP